MKRLKSIFRVAGFHVFLFFLGVILFGWPLITIAEKEGSAALFIYLFSIWCIIILFLFFIARSLPLDNSEETREGRKG